MNKPYMTASDYVEDMPTPLAKFIAKRVISNAITKAKITDGTYKPQKIICRLANKNIPADYHLNLKK